MAAIPIVWPIFLKHGLDDSVESLSMGKGQWTLNFQQAACRVLEGSRWNNTWHLPFFLVVYKSILLGTNLKHM